jgi:O-acetyl-ADP-ribose deacetylase (regulator of RNase III)
MTKQKISRLGLALLLLVLITLIFTDLFLSLSHKPFIVPGLSDPQQSDVVALLNNTITAGDSLQPGAVSNVATLRTNDGNEISIIVAEGHFRDSEIDPLATWAGLLNKPTMIISSADELLRNDGGISQAIGAGCSIAEVGTLLVTGTVELKPCKGSYKQHFPKVDYVGNAIIVAWKGVSEVPNCKIDPMTAIGSTQPGYSACIQKAIQDALWNLFNRQEMTGLHTVVLPALGTGTGRLTKGQFYQSAVKSLEKCLAAKTCEPKLPKTIIFAVWSGDTSVGGWPDTRDAIARNLIELGSDWASNYTPTTSIQKRARFVGVLLALFAFVIILSLQSHLPVKVGDWAASMGEVSLWVMIFGWFFVAAGAFSVLADFVDIPVSSNSPHPYLALILNIVFGIVAAVSCGFINKSMKLFGDA